jgi:transcriptional regulator with PAS, ATPase and Fis domain
MQRLDEIITDKRFAKAFISSLPVGVLIIQDAKWIIAANDVVQKVFKLSEDDLAGKALGQALGCLNALAGCFEVRQPLSCSNCEDGLRCPATDECMGCEIKNIILTCSKNNTPVSGLVKMDLALNGQVRGVSLKVQAVPYIYDDERLTALILDDISAFQSPPAALLRDHFHGITTCDPQMLQIIDTIKYVAGTDLTVLITGESGTGKELAAAAIHKISKFNKGHFVPFNCGALPEGVAESELFGHVKGAFTGAHRDKKGRFELAHQGTLFMDEVAELTPLMQAKLLRVLEDLKFERVGGEQTIHVNTRIIAATNKDLKSEVAAGRFREDLFYRLSVVPISLPPLSTRQGDLSLLTDHFLQRFGKDMNLPRISISPEAKASLGGYRWPGNVRELQNAIKFSLIQSKGERIEIKHLPPHLNAPNFTSLTTQRPTDLRQADIDGALEATGGNKRQAARRLGISRSTLYRLLRRFKS